MAAAKRQKSKPRIALPAIEVTEKRGPELRAFYDGAGQFPDFGYARFYWTPGCGSRESIQGRILKKRRPAGAESETDTAARVEALVTRDAPQDYADPDFLVRRYEDTLPMGETTAYAQVTLRFGSDVPNLHYPYEVARAWLREFYVEGRGVPLIAILHAPHLVGSDSPGHVHGIIFPKRLSKLGFVGAEREIASDVGNREAFESWQAFKADRL